MHILKRPINLTLLGTVTVITLSVAGCQTPREASNGSALRAKAILQSGGKYSEAIEQGKQATAQDPSNPVAWYWLGSAYFCSTQYDDATTALHKALDLDNLNPEQLEFSYYLLGTICYQKENYAQAILLLRKAVAAEEPPDTSALNNLGWAYRKSGQLQPAIEAFKRAVELKPDDSDFRTSLQRALDADLAVQAESFAKASLSDLLARSDQSVAHARARNRAFIAAKNNQLPAILRDRKTDELSALVVKIEQTILDLDHECEVAKDRAQQATAANGDPRQIDELRGLAICYRERIELLKPVLTALKEEIANRGR